MRFLRGCRTLLNAPRLVVIGQIAVLAETLGVVHLLLMLTGPCTLCAASAMVAVYTHALRVIWAVGMGTIIDLALLINTKVAFNARHMHTVGVGHLTL